MGRAVNNIRQNRLNTILFSVALLVVAVGGAYVLDQNNKKHLAETRLEVLSNIDELRGEMSERLQKLTVELSEAAARLAVSETVTDELFLNVGRRLKARDSLVSGIYWAPSLTVSAAYATGQEVYPKGTSLEQTSDLLPDLRRAQTSRNASYHGPETDPAGYTRIDILQPVTSAPDGDGSVEFLGMLIATIDADAFLAPISSVARAKQLELAIRGSGGKGEFGDVFLGSEAHFSGMAVLTDLSLPNGSWQLAANPIGGWPRVAPNTPILAAAIVGIVLFLIGLLSNFLRQMAGWRRRHGYLSSALSSVAQGIALYDSNERLVLVNKKFRRLYARSQHHFVPGRQFTDILRDALDEGQVPAAVGRQEEWIAERVAVFRETSREREQQLDDGTWIRLADRKTPEGGTISIHADITELKNARRDAEQANVAKTEFLNTISHELRTPLTVILGYLGFLKKPDQLGSAQKLAASLPANGESRELLARNHEEVGSYVSRIDVAANHLLGIIEGILDFVNLDEQADSLVLQAIDLNRVVSEMIGQFALPATHKGLELQCDVPEIAVWADETKLCQIILNLVSNAVKFTDEGGVTITARDIGHSVEVSVADTGSGIPEGEKQRIFNHFYQIDNSSTRDAGGTGLGLAVVLGMVQMHGGTVWAEDNKPNGSVLKFTMPKPPSAEMSDAA